MGGGGGGGGVISTSPFTLLPTAPSTAVRSSAVTQRERTKENPIYLKKARRSAILLFSFAVLAPSPAAGFSLGFSGPKEWLRDQKRKASRFVLAPIEASRQSLRNAYLLLDDDTKSLEEIQGLLDSASRDCVPQTRSSIVAFQATTGVEVCTFRLIVKNAASLLDKGDPVKLEAETMLDELISSFSFLGNVINSSDLQLTGDRQKVKGGLMDTISTLDKFEQGIKDCLGLAWKHSIDVGADLIDADYRGQLLGC